MIKFGESERFNKALDYANEKYRFIKREVSKIPYLFHPYNVVNILRLSGYDDFIEHEDLLISALLHDVIEETDTEISEIENLFGNRVALIVSELTHPEGLSKEEWLESFKIFSKEAKIVKLADRIDNLSSMESLFFPKERRDRYREQAKIILKTCGDVSTNLYSKLFNLIYYGITPRSNGNIMLFWGGVGRKEDKDLRKEDKDLRKEDKDHEEYKNRVKKLIERVEKGEDSPEAYQQLLDKIEEVRITAFLRTKKHERNDRVILGYVNPIREYYKLIADPNYPFNKDDLKKKINALYKLIYYELLKPPNVPVKWALDDKKRIVENIRKVLGEENTEYFVKKYKINRLLRIRFEDTKYYKYYAICWTIAFIVLLTIFFVQRS